MLEKPRSRVQHWQVNRVGRPHWRRATSWAQLLPVIMFLSGPGHTVPGFDPTRSELTCPRCSQPAVSRSKHSGECRDCNWFVWSLCPEYSAHYAYSFGGSDWKCDDNHRFSVCVLCPRCWSVGFEDGLHWTCRGPQRHVVYRREGTCTRCRTGLLVRCKNERQWVCVACGRTLPAR